MHNESSSALFNLVHSMNKGEKRYFKLYAKARSPHKHNMHHLRLFDNIEKQKKYNEEKIVMLEIVKKEHLRVLKHYLHQLIIESLCALRSKGNDIDSKLSGMLEVVHIMRDRGLVKEEAKFLEKTKELAIKQERWGIALNTILLERTIAVRKQDFKTLEQLRVEMEVLLSKLNNLQEYMMLEAKVFMSIQKGEKQRKLKNKTLENLMAHPLLEDETKALSIGAKMLYYNILFQYCYFMKKNKAGYKILSKHLRLIEEAGIEVSELTYSVILNHFTHIQQNLGKYQEALSTIKKHRALVWKSKGVKIHALKSSYVNETNYYLMAGEFKKGTTIIKEIENELERITLDYPAQFNILYYNIAVIYFGANEYHNALVWINKIINHPKVTLREDVQGWIRILQLLTYYELNTPDILDRLIVSTYRFLFMREKLYQVEKSMLNFMRRLSKIDATKKALLEEFRRFKDELLQITKDPDEKKALSYFDLISWLESKIENRSFAEIVRRKIKSNLSIN